MELPNPLKLQKLSIEVADDPSKKFVAMFNPTQFSNTYGTIVQTKKTLKPGEQATETAQQMPPALSVKLLLDATGVTEDGVFNNFGFGKRSVKEQVNKFLEVCYKVIEKKHETNIVNIKWGIIQFAGRLSQVTINYSLFDATGQPLRAELDTSFIHSTDGSEEFLKLSSPDLTHVRVVKAGDTLPLLAREIYGSSRYYLFVAQANDLDDFRDLKPGTRLYFPPLEKGTA